MKSLKVLFAGLVLTAMFFACSPDSDEVTPDQQNQNLEKFDVKSDGVGSDPKDGDR